jgi:hypothetical protein
VNVQVLDGAEMDKVADTKILTVEYVQNNFDDVLAEIVVITNDATLKILDAHNKAMLECEIDFIANKIRGDIGDNIAFEMFLGGLYSEFSSSPTPDMTEKIIYKLRMSRYYKDVVVADKSRFKKLAEKVAVVVGAHW